MDVFTGISRNTTSTRFFQTLFNNLVIFPREPDQELNHGLGKFWSLTLFDEIPDFFDKFRICCLKVICGPQLCSVFLPRQLALCWWIFGQQCCVLCCLLLPLLSCVTCVTCACCILCLWIFGHANLHNHSSASLLLFFLLNPNNHRATLSALLCLEKLVCSVWKNIATVSPQWLPKVWNQRLLIGN